MSTRWILVKYIWHTCTVHYNATIQKERSIATNTDMGRCFRSQVIKQVEEKSLSCKSIFVFFF